MQYAWIQHHHFKNALEAKSKLLTLFNLKPNKAFTAFWKPEYERPGKYYIYIHRYTTFMITLLYETSDSESLRIISKKVRKANDSLIWLSKIWKLCFDLYSKLILNEFQDEGLVLLPGSMTKNDFDYIAPKIELQIFSSDSKLVSTLLRAFELSKLNEGKLDVADLQLFIVQIYSKLFIDFGGLEMTDFVADPNKELKDQGMLLFLHVQKRAMQVCKNPPKKSVEKKIGNVSDVDLEIQNIVDRAINLNVEDKDAETPIANVEIPIEDVETPEFEKRDSIMRIETPESIGFSRNDDVNDNLNKPDDVSDDLNEEPESCEELDPFVQSALLSRRNSDSQMNSTAEIFQFHDVDANPLTLEAFYIPRNAIGEYENLDVEDVELMEDIDIENLFNSEV